MPAKSLLSNILATSDELSQTAETYYNQNWGIYLTQVTPTSCGRQKQHFQCRR